MPPAARGAAGASARTPLPCARAAPPKWRRARAADPRPPTTSQRPDRRAAGGREALCAARSDRRIGPVVRLFARPLLRPREFETKGAFVNRRFGPCGVARRRAARSTANSNTNTKSLRHGTRFNFLVTILVFRIGSDWMHRIRLPCAVSMLNPCQPAERQRRRAGVMQATDKATNAQRHDFGRRIARPRDGSLFSACSFRSE